MAKKNKYEGFFERSPIVNNEVEKLETEEILPPIEKLEETEVQPPVEQPIYIKAKFSEEIVGIGYEFLATGEQNIISASNGKIYMLQGRQYYIPVDNLEIDSDNYNIKVHSDAADRFDVRYIKDGLAAVVPIRHNTILKNGERICILTPLNL